MSTWREKQSRAKGSVPPGSALLSGGPARGRVEKSVKPARRGGHGEFTSGQSAKGVSGVRGKPAAGDKRTSVGKGSGKGKGKRKGKGKGKGGASLRARIRGLQRTLAHNGDAMTPAARAAKEEEIVSLTALADDRRRREREREIAKKYHMVKFFERRKLQRRLAAVNSRLLKPGADVDELQRRKKVLENDLLYVNNFPKGVPYVALFPTDGHTDASRVEVERIRAEIHKGATASRGDAVSSHREDSGEDDLSGVESAAADPDSGEEDDFFL